MVLEVISVFLFLLLSSLALAIFQEIMFGAAKSGRFGFYAGVARPKELQKKGKQLNFAVFRISEVLLPPQQV